MTLKHLVTQIQTVFALENGTEQPQPLQPITLNIKEFTEREFVESYRMLAKRRSEMLHPRTPTRKRRKLRKAEK